MYDINPETPIFDDFKNESLKTRTRFIIFSYISYIIFFIDRLYEPFVLQKISSHYETMQPLPMEIIDNIKNMRSHLAGYKLCKELYLSHLDLELHSR